MIKKLVGCGLAAVVAINLWSGVPGPAKRIAKKLKTIEQKYKDMIKMTEEDTNPSE